jgi:hypothetical protein
VSSAHADPAWGTQANTATPLVGMGSNTIEDLFNALSGEEPSPGLAVTNAFGLSAGQVEAATHFYTPLHDNNGLTTGEGTDNQVYSWDALSPYTGTVDCVNAKAGFPNMVRANGSGNGKTAMSDAIEGVAWGSTAATCGSTFTSNPSGELDFTRSSSGPGSASCTPVYTPTVTPCLVYIDFAHDAVPYAYYAPGVANANPGNAANPADHYTTAQLQGVFSSTPSAPDVINGLTVVPCMPQQGSGTGNFWNTNALGLGAGPPTVSDTDAGLWQCGGTFKSSVAAVCAPAATPCSLEENGAISFDQFAANDLSTGFNGLVSGSTVFVIPFSLGSFVSQENGVALDRSSADVQTTTNTSGVALGVPVTGTAAPAGSLPYTGTISGLPPQSLAPNGNAITGFEGTAPYARDLYVITNNFMLNSPLGKPSKTFRGIFGFDGTNVTTALTDATSATTGTGAICQGAGTSTTPPPAPTTVATNPSTIAGPAQSYLSQFGFVSPLTSAGASNCGAEWTITPTTGTGTS